MDIKEFISNFAGELDETPVGTINEVTIFKELDDWTSLTALSIIAMIDEQYEVAVTGSDMRKATTILDLFNIVKSKIK